MTWEELVGGAKESPPAKIRKAVRVDVYGQDGDLTLIVHYGHGKRQKSEKISVRCSKADITAETKSAWFESLD